jgi:hypothetical protein
MHGWGRVGKSSVSCSVAGCDITDIEPSGHAATVSSGTNISSCT